MKYNFYHHSDAGHSWIAVKRVLIEQLGIADKISQFSYQNGDSVYLEEDCDAVVFLEALEKLGHTFEFRESYKDRSPIRSYADYKA